MQRVRNLNECKGVPECARRQRLGYSLRLKRLELIPTIRKKSTLTGYFATFTCCPPLTAILNCKGGVLRESLRTRARFVHSIKIAVGGGDRNRTDE